MNIQFSYADHTNLLARPLATIIDLTALSWTQADDLIRQWKKRTAQIPLEERISHELARIDDLLTRTARDALRVDPEVLRYGFRHTARHIRSLQFMGIILIPYPEEIPVIEYSTTPAEDCNDAGYWTVPYIGYPKITCAPEFADIRIKLGKFIFKKSHDFFHSMKEFPSGHANIMLGDHNEVDFRAAILTAILADPDLHKARYADYQELMGAVGVFSETRAAEVITTFINLNAGYAIHPDRLPPLAKSIAIPSGYDDQPWRVDAGNPDKSCQPIESFKGRLLKLGTKVLSEVQYRQECSGQRRQAEPAL